jgi:hypothetical protein
MARQRNMGVIGMKPLGDGLVLKSGAVTPVEGLRYAMSIPPDVTVTGIDSMRILDQDLNIAKGFRPLTQSEKLALLEKTTQAARNGQYELYKTTHRFDGTYQNPAYLG